MLDFVAFLFGEKLLKTSISVAVLTVEHVDSSGVEDQIEDDSSE